MVATNVDRKQNHDETRAEEAHGGRHFVPRADVREEEAELTVTADVPGVGAQDVDIQYERGELRIHGRVRPREHDGTRLLREYEVGDYYRAFRVGEGVDAGAITADVKDGVLTLHLPKTAGCKPRQIAVTTG